jgi:FAD/FMN-containing dehydrogenase/Fe-S oxidoreductase
MVLWYTTHMQNPIQPDPASAELLNDLNKAGIEASSDRLTRILYSTDASIYQILPVGVAWPKNDEEVIAAVECALKNNTPVLPRGGGTSLAGQAIGKALILDFSRYMDSLLDLNLEERTVTVQPGVILGWLNRQLRDHGLIFGPDPASADRATMGGVLGNNATGAHSILYGMAHDHLIEAEVILSDASRVRFRELDSGTIKNKQRMNTREGSIYGSVASILDQYRDQIIQNYPKTFRNVAGYNLNVLSRQERLNLAPLLVGSEGTLGVITSAKLNLVPLPDFQTLYLVHFPDLKSALESVQPILETSPSAVELVDRMLIELARENPAYRPLLSPIMGDPAAVLAVEYQGDDLKQLSGKESLLAPFGLVVPLLGPREQDQFWKARKVGLGILQSKRGDAKPTTFIEDAAVPVEYLAAYALGIRSFADEIGVGGIAFYAHASAGCLHIRPQVNLKSEQGLKQMRLLAEKSLELVLKFGGSTSGEHGEGISRGEFMKGLFGPELTSAFHQTKEAFDPDYIFNPGKIIHPPEMDNKNLLRYGTNYRAEYQPKETLLSFKEDQGFDRAVEMCNGAGVCRQLDGGVMCPTFQATRDETHSTRGRANTLRAAISGRLGPNGMTSSELYKVMELCLSCQACLNECPSAVDMSKLKAEYLHQYHQKHSLPFRSWFFANIEEISKFIQPLSFLVNPLLAGPTGSLVSLIGVHPDRKMPAFAKESFTKWLKKQTQTEGSNGSRQVVFFYDTYLEYNYPHIGKAVVKIFKKAGTDLIVLPEKVDSGRPAYSKGALSKAKTNAIHNLKLLEPYAQNGIPIVGVEPSAVVMLKKEYRDLVPGKEANQVAELSSLIEDYLIQGIETERFAFQFDGKSRKVLYHGHCQQKANLGTEKTLELLRLIPNCSVEEIEAGCCGMAGAFGYEREHYFLSLEIAEMALAPRIRKSAPDTIIAASGTSCREQILHTTGRKAFHPLEVFAEALV